MENAAPEPGPPAPPVQGWVKMTPCAKCGQAIDPTRAIYSKQGELICKSCESGDLLAEGYMRSAKSACFGALGTGVVGFTWFFFLFFFFPLVALIISIAAVVQGIRAIILINRREYREVLGPQYASMMIAAIAGTLFGMVSPSLTLLGILVAATAVHY